MLSVLTSLEFCHLIEISPLPNNKILDQSKLKASKDDKINASQNGILSWEG